MLINEEKYQQQFRTSLHKYAEITDSSFSELLSLMKFRTFEKGDFLLHAGQIATKLHYVCEGIVTAMFITEEGNTHIKNFFLEGYFAASTVSLLQSSASAFSLQALTEGIVIDMDYRRFRQLIYERDDLKHFYMHYLEQSWIIQNERRQISFATQTAKERYLTFLEQYPTLEELVPQLHIASYLGITPTQLSRIRKDLV